jgi:hypothetical protein
MSSAKLLIISWHYSSGKRFGNTVNAEKDFGREPVHISTGFRNHYKVNSKNI